MTGYEEELLRLVKAHGLELRGGDPWKCGDEFLPFHPMASHVPAEYRDGWNRCFVAALGLAARIRQEEREAAAKVCDGLERRKWETIRDGGTLTGFGARDCAAAIRARGESQ